jgi:hypothetical protein
MSKTVKIKPTPKIPASAFVITISNVCGYDTEHDCIKLKDGYTSVVQIPGIDILNYKKADQEYVYTAFGQATQGCPEAHKAVILSDRSHYTEQIEFLKTIAAKADHPYRKYLLERQIEWLKYYESTQNDRLAYVFFYAKTPEDAASAADHYVNTMRTGRNYSVHCDREQCERVLQLLLQGGDAV